MLDIISPYEALYCSVFGVQADTLSYSQDGMCRRMFDGLIDKLNFKEKLVIGGLYGYGHARCSEADLAKELACTLDEVERLKDTALDRLRDPDNYRYLEKRWYSGNDILKSESELDYRGKIKAELVRYMSGRNNDIDYIWAVMKKNDISVRRVYRNVTQTGDGEVFESSFAGKKGIDDTIKALRAFKISAKPVEGIRKKKAQRGNIETVLITQNGIEQAYKYSGLSDEDIAECVYHVIFDGDGERDCILNFNISDGLMGILLLKGYLYIDTLMEDKEKICRELAGLGVENQLREFSEFSDKAEIYLADKRHAPMTFVVVPALAAHRIYEMAPVDYHELLSCAESVDMEFAVTLIKNSKREFRDFAGLSVTDDARRRIREMIEEGPHADAV